MRTRLMKLEVRSWDDIDLEQGVRTIETEIKEDWTPEQVAVAVDLAVERYNREEPGLEETGFMVMKACGMPESGFAVYTDDRDHIGMLLWQEVK